MSKITLDQVADILKEHNNIRIICHRSPDGDTIGSAYALLFALRGMGKKCCVVCSDELPKKFGYITDNAEVQEFDVEFTIAVDVADRPLLGKVLILLHLIWLSTTTYLIRFTESRLVLSTLLQTARIYTISSRL